jgi:glycosyltransferase involved in cell wall biosynthesis
MTVAYLTNQYPHVRHTFIRREILGLEGYGIRVARFSIRRADTLVDPTDQDEAKRTEVLLSGGALGLLGALLATVCRRPFRWLAALVWAVRLGWRSGHGLRHLAYLAEACVLLRRLERCGARHLHVHFATNPATVALLTRTLGGPPYSITIHGPEEWDRPEALSLSIKYAKAAFIVAVSDYGRCQVFRWTNSRDWSRVHLVRCGVDGAFLSSETTPVPDAPVLVTVAALVEAKGHRLWLEALARLKERNEALEAVLVGDGPLRGELEALTKERGLTNVVRFVGWQSSAEVRQHLLRARALVMPSFAENLPVAIMEAFALGRPVVATQIAGIPELVRDGVNGWLVAPASVDAFCDAVAEVLRAPPEQLTRMGRAGAARVAEMHDASREAGRLAALFRQSMDVAPKRAE